MILFISTFLFSVVAWYILILFGMVLTFIFGAQIALARNGYVLRVLIAADIYALLWGSGALYNGGLKLLAGYIALMPLLFYARRQRRIAHRI